MNELHLLDETIIQEISKSGYFIDKETAENIGRLLDNYRSILESRSDDELDNSIRHELMSDEFLIAEICEKLGIEGY